MPVAKADGITVIGSSGMLGSGGYRIAGELRNDVSATVGNVVVTASLLDSYGNLMSSISGGPFVKTLRPGEKSAFVLSLADAKVGSRVASYKLDTAWNSGTDKPSTQESSPAQQTTVIAVGLDMPSYHYADTVRVTGNVSSLVAGESLVTIELLYPDGSVLNSFQVPLIKNSYFASFDMVASSEFDGKTFTVRATYASSSTAASLKYLGSGTPQPVKQDIKQNSARLSMSASLNDQKVMILTIKNPKGSEATVYGMNVKVDKGSIKSAIGTAGWKAKVDGSLAKFTTNKPVMAGKIANFKLKVSDTVHAISWSVVDKDGHVIDSNTAVVKAKNS